MQALHIIVFCIFSYASALDIFIDSPVLLLDCRIHASEEPVEYSTMFNSTKEPGKGTTKSQNTEQPIGQKELFDAASEGDLSFVSAAIARLSSSGLDLNWRNADHYGETALYTATENDHQTIIAALLEAGADPGAQNDGGYNDTPVYLAANKGYTGALELLLDYGADPNKTISDGSSPLDTASYNGHVEAARMLIQAGAHVDYAYPNDGTSALHSAAWQEHADVALLLLQNGAQKDKQSFFGKTPAYWSRTYGDGSVVQLLDDY